MFEFTKPTEEVREADAYDDGRELVHDIIWRSAGVFSANTYWIVNSSDDEWFGFKTDFVPTIKDPEASLGWRYDHENEFTEIIWVRKDEMLQFISCCSIAERMNVVVRSNRFDFVMDHNYGPYCQVIREVETGHVIYMDDRANIMVLWVLIASGWDEAEEATNKKYSTYRFMHSNHPVMLVQKDGKLVGHSFCIKCNEIIEDEWLEYAFVEGMCYECKQKEKSS